MMAKQAAPAPRQFTGYQAFYESLGGNLFAGDGMTPRAASRHTLDGPRERRKGFGKELGKGCNA
ncbi:hypothetical protein FGX01_05390, partial [Xylella fastidiosa subsp. multiplex]|nr:hypothetical protein [Xylella fastidiosa subsp. multiplex]